MWDLLRLPRSRQDTWLSQKEADFVKKSVGARARALRVTALAAVIGVVILSGLLIAACAAKLRICLEALPQPSAVTCLQSPRCIM